jgi:hypothetical protein
VFERGQHGEKEVALPHDRFLGLVPLFVRLGTSVPNVAMPATSNSTISVSRCRVAKPSAKADDHCFSEDSEAASVFDAAMSRTESRRQRLRVGPVPSPRYSGERVRVRGSSNVKITHGSPRKFRDLFSVNHQEFDEMLPLNGSGKKTPHPNPLPGVPGRGDTRHSSP